MEMQQKRLLLPQQLLLLLVLKQGARCKRKFLPDVFSLCFDIDRELCELQRTVKISIFCYISENRVCVVCYLFKSSAPAETLV